MSELIFREESYKIMGACFEVYKHKGCGFLEGVYQEYLAVEFAFQNIPFMSQPKIELEYKGTKLKQYFEPDFICYEKIVVEIKAISKLAKEHKAQTINYLYATNFELALLVNFGHFPMVEHERFGNRPGYRSLHDEIASWIK
jgi:GxxExxY protein